MKIVFLRKGLNIKASVIFLAWLMLFGHGIIPHNHAEADCNEFTHAISLSGHSKNCSAQDEFSSQCIQDCGCSISNVLFHKFGQDELLSFIAPDVCAAFYLNSKKHFFGTNEIQVPLKFLCSVPFRAPPAA